MFHDSLQWFDQSDPIGFKSTSGQATPVNGLGLIVRRAAERARHAPRRKTPVVLRANVISGP
jgi:hypothetical protein